MENQIMVIFIRLAILIFMVIVVLFAMPANARTVEAADCSQQDVQKAIDAAMDGDIVLVPAGSAVWTTSQKNRPAVVISAKGREKQITMGFGYWSD